ncbi:NADP-dependent oxidoreductase [Oceanobacillus halophilus]|uniref:NADP-dependent oxidoreductase n=1 Tax=Oceanobacillus halophilus TaxID=930130 RepID=A0A495A7E5_9BACI|nr:NADP-dependent oxidoreductase [Oceanobacillus halophilus]RKQ35727.1 NADP-dependent oxidoreductase [Oceanobacillus halophilus]
MESKNRSILLVSRPKGMPIQDNFKLIEEPLPSIRDGEVLVETIYLSVDPYMRGRMRGIKTYTSPYNLNEVLTGGVVGRIVESKNKRFEIGDIIEGRLGWSDYSVSNGRNIRKVNPNLAPITTALGVVGMPGLTAYFGLLDIGKPKSGETVVVSGAAGAVGTVVGQIAKNKGCRVIGIAGSEEKNEYLEKELGFDATINYKEENLREALKDKCPDGVDIYFDNVGGVVTDHVMYRLNFQARIIVCGQISEYNSEEQAVGPRVQRFLLNCSALMKAFIVSDYSERFSEGYQYLGDWVQQGKLKYRENIIEGLENAPNAFIGLFKGENIGKQLVRVKAE